MIGVDRSGRGIRSWRCRYAERIFTILSSPQGSSRGILRRIVIARPTLPDLNTLDREALQALLVAEHEQWLSTQDELQADHKKLSDELLATRERLQTREQEIEHLKLLLSQLRRMQFGRKSEKLERQIEQLELRLEDLQQSQPSESTQASGSPHPSAATASGSMESPAKPSRRALPAHLPRRTRTHLPKHTTCPDCGGELRKLGEDISELLDYLPANFVVIRHVRPKLSCAHCERIVQASAPSRPIARGVAGPGLLAHVLVSKYCEHLPLYRQSEIYERAGVELERSTLADWVGGSSELLDPLVEALRRYVMAAAKVHADDTPVAVLAPGNGKTKTGRLWTYVRDNRPAGDTAAPAVWFAYSPDRKGEHPERHLRMFRGALQADAYAGFNQLYKEDGRIQEVACGRTFGASSTTCSKRMHRPSPARLWNESQLCMPLRRRFADDRPSNGNGFVQNGRDP